MKLNVTSKFSIINKLRIFKRNSDQKPIWNNLIENEKSFWESRKKSASGPKVLIATSLGGYNQGTVVESTLAVALTLRNAKVEILLCDKFLPVCQMTKIGKISPEELTEKGQLKICSKCFSDGIQMFYPLGLRINLFSSFVTGDNKQEAKSISQKIALAEIRDFRYKNIKLGEHAYAGTLRYFARGDLNNEKSGSEILRQYLESSILSLFAIESILKRKKYDIVCFHHGIYVPQGIIGEVARKMKVKVVNWNPSYKKHTFIFSHNDSYHHTMISEPTKFWKNINLSSKIKIKTIEYLKSRRYGINDWIWFHEKSKDSIKKLSDEFKIDPKKPVIGLLTSVVWDAVLHYRSNAFPNMIDWVIDTINFFKLRPDLQLIIRIHPAEKTGMIPSRQSIESEIKKNFKKLPENCFVIAPENPISTYEVIEKSNAVIIYNTKAGIEISSLGIPVIVAGEAWIRNKGFTKDANNPEEYFKILNTLPFPTKMEEKKLIDAIKYAYHFFFRRMIPLPFIKSQEQFVFDLNLNSITNLGQGKYKGLDVICNGILKGTPFIYHDENYN